MVGSDAGTKSAMTADILAFAGYLDEIIKVRALQPGNDLLSLLILAHHEGQRLNAIELVALMQELIMGGVDTTANVIGNAIWLLLDNPGELQRLRNDRSLTKSCIEEVLRCEPATLIPQFRVATRNFTFYDQDVVEGAIGVALLGTANRDTSKYEVPHTFDISRTANEHVAFGAGPHFCIGAPFARMEMDISLTKLLDRFTVIEWDQRPRWKKSTRVHGPEFLRVRLK